MSLNKSVYHVILKYFDREKRAVPNWLNDEITSNIRRHYRANSFVKAKLGKRGAAIKDIVKSLQYPDLSMVQYLLQIMTVLISPALYSRIKRQFEGEKS